jgi:hypothetical protein
LNLNPRLVKNQAPFTQTFYHAFQDLETLPDAYKRFRYYSDLRWVDYGQGKIPFEHLRIARIVLTLESFGISLSENKAQQAGIAFGFNHRNRTINRP